MHVNQYFCAGFFISKKMKKKIIIVAAVICTFITAMWIVARITGMLQYYSIPTPSNEPNIKPGDKVFSSNLKDPVPADFIIYTSEYSDSINVPLIPGFKYGTHYLHRLCGVPGNILEMRNGILYVNNKNFDENLNLYNQYKITGTEFYLIEQDDINALEAVGGANMISGDTALVAFDNALIKKYQSKIKLVPFIINDTTPGCFAWYDKNPDWTADNFGPLKIPTGCYFVLGDNRHNAFDSRYFGFVKKENIKGVALNK
jgi:signal peptidase I